jgi:phosphate transport system substrate-binding protein
MTHLIVFLSLFLSQSAISATPLVKIDGSSTVFPVIEAISEEFQKGEKGAVNVTVGISGTGGGFKKFCRGETALQNASRPIAEKEMEDCRKNNVRYFELPIGFDAIAVVVNPKNKWVKDLSTEELKKIWEPEAQGKITKWNQVNPQWPDRDLKLYGAGADSGTFDYFTEAVVGKAKASRGDFTASEDDNTLVLGVANDQNALGFMPMSYYETNKSRLRLVGIRGGEKAPKKNNAVLPSKATVIDGSYYPLSRPMFVYVSESEYKRPEVKRFMDFSLNNAYRLVSAVNYIPLPPKAYKMGQDHLKKGRVGTAFKGHAAIGATIEEILKREAAL